MKVRWILGSVAVVTVSLAGPTLANAVSSPPLSRFGEGEAGDAGIGDHYFPLMGNGGYDVASYKINMAYDPDTGFMQGRTVIRATATQNLTQFNLDLQGLRVQSVAVRGAEADWSRDLEHELVVQPARRIGANSAFKTVVRYQGVPRTLILPGTEDPMGFIPTADGALIAGEPEVAATWYPVNDHPLDKAQYTFIITVPEGLEAVANGQLVDRHTEGGLSTWRWRQKEPMASYLATATMGDFRTSSDETPDGLRIYNAIDPALYLQPSDPDDSSSPSLGRIAERTFARIPNQIRFLESIFGPYPFKDAGGIADDAPIRFALENQTRPIYAPHWFEDPFVAPIVQIHELAHQWYGDSVSVQHWRHIWLNEGFTTYSEWLWLAHVFDDPGVPHDIFVDLYENIPRRDPFWHVTIGDPGVDHLFDDPVYARGAMTLEVLRQRVGDDDFFRILRRWASSHALGNGSTSQFIQLSERISHQPLDDLFDEWLSSDHKPPRSATPVGRSQAEGGAQSERSKTLDWYEFLQQFPH